MTKTALFAAASVIALIAGPALADDAPPREVSEVVVTGAPYVVSMDSTTTAVNVVRRDELDTAASGGLGDVLSGLPGVRSTFFGPGASRPVIRGLSGPRVLVLTNGVGMIDASALSPDHQVATDPQEAERIEVLRGPSALAYGGSAIGGVVNIIDDRISEKVVDGFHGRLTAATTSVDDGTTASAAFKLGVGKWVFGVDGTHRESSDYKIPVPAESRRQLAADGEAFPGPVNSTVENTAVDLYAYGGGASYVGDGGFLGLAVKRTETTYGVPGHAHEDGGAPGDEGGVLIDLEQTRYDLRGGLNLDLGLFNQLKVSAGYADYEHAEIEGGAVGTLFLSDGWEARAELVQVERDGWQGAVGVQGLSRTIEAIGDEAFIPSTEIKEVGAFTLQRLDRDGWGVEGGLRLDRRELKSAFGSRDFTNVSASLGAFVRPAAGWFLGLSGARTSRAPTEVELFANGPHAATRGFEQGDLDLGSEISYSLDATLHYGGGPWDMDMHVFGVRYDGFVDLRPTGLDDPDSGLALFDYVQTDAEFYGAEVELGYRLWEDGDRSFSLEGAADYVRGDTDLGAPARIPPWSVTGRAVFEGGWWTGKLELRQVGDQDRVAEAETATDGYRILNASLIMRPFDDKGLKIFADVRNLNDAEAREHASFLKDLAPLPGRSFRIGAGYTF
ncbi:TonB-dependent receptor [Phenylobacterium sp. LH3H17]|uniref:TonB-dependent receptor n=1 Tax=Phenylobacterium sp. LH3H17 TaxID=2903901 RepID=UPI0020C9FC56|nr:TonB-dependent receptor [Phenylobacterium sp. LH3H17]UTP40657.1 TonB-dependent receptor [Phenylobacterium sp. LH3H17]